MTPTTILREAEVELWEGVSYYEEKAAGLGLDFQIGLEKSIQLISEHPERWPLREDGTRRFLLPRFPYVIIYSYMREHIWILAIAHCKRNPGYWTGRQKAEQ